MVAYILQILFAVLSLWSLCIIIVMIFKNNRATKKQWRWLLLPILLLFMTIAYRFDYISNPNNDLSRYFLDFEGLKYQGFFYEMRYADAFSWLYRVIAYVFCNLDNLHWYPAFTMAVDFGIYFYILSACAEDNKLSALDVLLCLLLRLSLLPLIMSVSASRNTMAYSFFSMGVYMYYKHGLKHAGAYLWMLAGVLTHTTVVLGIAIFAVSLIGRKYKIIIPLLLVLSAVCSSLIVPILVTSGNEYLQFLAGKWDVYTSSQNQYDITKTIMMQVGVLPLFCWMLCWFLSKNESPKKRRTSYMITNMAASIGISVVMPLLFLRMSYATAILMPILWSEVKNTQWSNHRNAQIYGITLIAIVLLLFASTKGGWLWEIYWFFEL